MKVSASGSLPLYQSHGFEKAVKNWFTQQLKKRQGDFKTKLQEAERMLIKQFPTSAKFVGGLTLNSSLSESLKFQGDYIQASFINEFDSGVDYSEFEKQLVQVKPTFSSDNEYKKDVQVTIDENLVNHFLMGFFYSQRSYSLLQEFMKRIPGELSKIASIGANLFTTTLLRPIFPQLAKEVGDGRKVDLKCGFSKDFLDGKLDDTHISQVWFKKDNVVEAALHFGCGIFYSKSTFSSNPMAILGAFDPKNEDWLPWRHFFTSFKTNVKFEFGSNNMAMNGLMTGKIKELNLDVLQVQVYQGDKILEVENVLFEEAIQTFARKFNDFDIPSIFDKIPVLKGVPITPVSRGLKCMGLTPQRAAAEFQDRFLRIAFDMKVEPANKKCLFEAFEDDDVKFDRWSKDASKKGLSDVAKGFNNARKSISDRAKEYAGFRTKKSKN